MGSKPVLWVLLVSLFSISFLPSMVNPQILACPVQAIDMSFCMKQDVHSMKTCCRAINQVVAVGYHCFCSLLGNMNSLFDGQILFAFSTCFVPLPPLAKCKVSAPVEAVLPPKTREDPLSASKPNVVLPPLPSPIGNVQGEDQPSLQVPREKNPTSLPAIQKPRASEISNSTRKSKGAKIRSISLYKTIIVIVVFHCILEGL